MLLFFKTTVWCSAEQIHKLNPFQERGATQCFKVQCTSTETGLSVCEGTCQYMQTCFEWTQTCPGELKRGITLFNV